MYLLLRQLTDLLYSQDLWYFFLVSKASTFFVHHKLFYDQPRYGVDLKKAEESKSAKQRNQRPEETGKEIENRTEYTYRQQQES
jgi:hypothetical protein